MPYVVRPVDVRLVGGPCDGELLEGQLEGESAPPTFTVVGEDHVTHVYHLRLIRQVERPPVAEYVYL